jgi:chromosome condensin MukBEF ATPase and DNA-binding subunit MukB
MAAWPAQDFTVPTHPLLDLSDALERATDAYMVALDEEAEAENAYLREFHVAYAVVCGQGIAVTARKHEAENVAQVVEARCVWNLAVARVKSARAKCSELEARLTAHQSYFRLVGAQT